MVAASTITRAKRLIPIDASETSKDALLTDVLAAVSRSIELYLGYDFEQKSRTELYSPAQNDQIILLRTIPVVSVTSIKVASDSDFSSATALQAGTEYRLRDDPNEGVIWCEPGTLVAGVDTVQVVYVAGLGATTNDVITAAPDIAYAVDLQVAEEFRRSTSPTTQSRPGPRGARSFTSPHGLLARVQEILSPYRRVLMPAGVPTSAI